MQFYCHITIRPKKDTKLCLRVEKWSRSISHLFLIFTERFQNEGNMSLFDFLPSSQDSNVYPRNIHTFIRPTQ
jgi:hypothetical protein